MTLTLADGSVRHLLSKTTQNPRFLKTEMRILITPCPDLKDIKHLIPDSYVVGDSDRVPGLKHHYLPFHYSRTLERQIRDIIPDASTLLHIEGIKVHIDQNIETLLLREAEKVRNDQFIFHIQGQIGELSDCYIRHRKLLCIAHNTWTAVNFDGFNNFRKLVEDPQVPGQFIHTGRVTLENIFSDELLMAVFQLEYESKAVCLI